MCSWRDLTIWANKIELALFIGMHGRYATMLSLREFDVKKMDHRYLPKSPQEVGGYDAQGCKTVRLIDTQIRANHGVEWVTPVEGRVLGRTSVR